MKPPDTLFVLVESFFCDYLQKVRGASAHTVAAYRDAMMLFLRSPDDSQTSPLTSVKTPHRLAWEV